jgi:hypothetical protein
MMRVKKGVMSDCHFLIQFLFPISHFKLFIVIFGPLQLKVLLDSNIILFFRMTLLVTCGLCLLDINQML